MSTYPYGMKDLPRVTALPRLGLPHATQINDRASTGLRSITFNTSQTWVAPAGVQKIRRAYGKGGSGTPPGYYAQSLPLLSVSGGAVSGADIYYAEGEYSAASQASDLVASGAGIRTITYNRVTITVGSDGTATRASSQVSYSVDGSRISYNQGSGTGQITQSNASQVFANHTFSTQSSGSNGQASTGFGQSFPGGTSANTSAPVTTINNIDITPGASYSIVIAGGGSITIEY